MGAISAGLPAVDFGAVVAAFRAAQPAPVKTCHCCQHMRRNALTYQHIGAIVRTRTKHQVEYTSLAASAAGDHIALYVISSWTQQANPAPNYEIAERGFFPIDALPSGATAGVVHRIAEVMQGASRAQTW
jgi:hypothetical protein